MNLLIFLLLAWTNSGSSCGDGEVYLVSYSTATRYTFSHLMEVWVPSTLSKFISMSPKYMCENPSIGTPS